MGGVARAGRFWTYREVAAAYLRDDVPVRAVPVCVEGETTVSGWDGAGEPVGQPGRGGICRIGMQRLFGGWTLAHLRTFLSE